MQSNILENIIFVFINSSIILGVLIYIAKKYFDKVISHIFDKKLNDYLTKKQHELKKADLLLENQLGIYPEIIELIYRLRNILKDGLNKQMVYDWNNDLRPLCAHLTENLYKYRLFLPQDIFNSLHEFKHICQDALLLVDTLSRKEYLFDHDEYQFRINVLRDKLEFADGLYYKLVDNIQKKINPNGD